MARAFPCAREDYFGKLCFSSPADRQIAWGVDIPRDWLPFFLLLSILVTSSADSAGTKIECGFSRSTLGQPYLSVVCAGCCDFRSWGWPWCRGALPLLPVCTRYLTLRITSGLIPLGMGFAWLEVGVRRSLPSNLSFPVSQLMRLYLPAHRSKQEYQTCLYFL